MSHPCCLCCRNMMSHCRKIGKSSCDEQVQICCRQSRRRRRHRKTSAAATALSSLLIDLAAKMPAAENFDKISPADASLENSHSDQEWSER
uniref:Uncharacterized protein n=1 Tax=Romanomermis culicivorax TaxID=13658 RepID=A0A915LAK3_ROMCU